MGSSGLAEVATGWTGTIATTVTATATVTPTGRQSAASIVDDLLRLSAQTHGGTWSASADSNGVLTISSSLTFTLAATLLTRSRLGFTRTYASAKTYTALYAHTGGAYPSRGVLVDGVPLVTQLDASVGDGSSGWSGRRTSAGLQLTAHGTFASLWSYEIDAAGVYDIWSDGRVYARVRVDGWRRSRLGRLASEVRLTAQASEVRV